MTRQGTARPGGGEADNRCNDRNRIPVPFLMINRDSFEVTAVFGIAPDYSFIRRTCPHAGHRPCSAACVFFGVQQMKDGDVFVCKTLGKPVVIGIPDPENQAAGDATIALTRGWG